MKNFFNLFIKYKNYQLPSIRVNQSQLESIRVNQSQLESIRVNQSQLESIRVNQSQLESIRVNQSQLESIRKKNYIIYMDIICTLLIDYFKVIKKLNLSNYYEIFEFEAKIDHVKILLKSIQAFYYLLTLHTFHLKEIKFNRSISVILI